MLNVRLGRIPCLGEFTRTDGLIYVRVLHKWKISTKSPINAHRLHERITRGLKKTEKGKHHIQDLMLHQIPMDSAAAQPLHRENLHTDFILWHRAGFCATPPQSFPNKV